LPFDRFRRSLIVVRYCVSHQGLSDLIGHFWKAACEPSLWTDAVAHLRDAFHGSKGCLIRFDPIHPKQSEVIAPDDRMGADGDVIERFMTASGRLKVPEGLVYSDTDLIDRKIWRKSAWYNEYMLPQNMYSGIAVNLTSTEDACEFIDIQRGKRQPEFDMADRATLALLAPHIAQANKLRHLFHKKPGSVPLLESLPFGAFVVDRGMRVVAINTSAARLLARPNGDLTARHGFLSAAGSSRAGVLERTVERLCAESGDGLPSEGSDHLIRIGETGELVISAGPFHAQEALDLPPGMRLALLIARESADLRSPAFQNRIRAAYGLTAKEAGIALALASGSALKTAAAQQSITFGTARVHLEHIFRKTKTGHQNQLVALLNRLRSVM
jgi:DNA-binding CsgD family transcriptional regulator